MRHSKFVILYILITIIFTACKLPASIKDQSGSQNTPGITGSTQTPDQGSLIPGIAIVDSLDVFLLESFPVQVNVSIHGNLPDGCTMIDKIETKRQDSNFNISITTLRPADALCTQALVPYEKQISLDVYGLAAGQYKVIANGIESSFVFSQDNILGGTEKSARINGSVWHDLCAATGLKPPQPIENTSGCTEFDTGYRANGSLDPGESGIAGISVDLGSGECPSSGLMTVTTGQDGTYQFSGLTAGTYCVSVRPLSDKNKDILVPGSWSYPPSNIGEQTITLNANENKTGIHFGWDFTNLPEVSVDNCTDIVAFVADVTIPDDTIISPGQKFTKTWKLQNKGTCKWDSNYSLVFHSGDQMNAPEKVPLVVVNPGDTVDVSIELTAPQKDGSYRGDFRLENKSGKPFGLGGIPENTFWVQILVGKSITDLGLGAPTWRDGFDAGNNWYLFEADNSRFSVEKGHLVMSIVNPDGAEVWTLGNRVIENFYLEISGETQDCTGLDRYGMIFRSPDETQGYLFSITCDGRFSFRKWDGTKYTILKNWTQSTQIITNPGEFNRFGVKAEGSTFTLYVNGTQVAVADDASYSKGRFGFFIAAASTKNFKVELDEVLLWLIP